MSSLERKWEKKYKAGPNAKTFKCNCKEPGSIVIDPDSSTMICGIVGIVDLENTRIYMNGKISTVVCVNCSNAIEIK